MRHARHRAIPRIHIILAAVVGPAALIVLGAALVAAGLTI